MSPTARHLLAWLVAGALALGLAACDRQAQLRIGFLAELSGPNVDLGEAGRNGALLAIDQFRDSSAGQSRAIEVLVRDTGSDAASAQKAAEELARAGVDVIIGPMTSAMVDTLLPVAEREKIALVTPTASAAKYHGKDDMLFRLNWTTRDNARNYAEHYFSKGIRRIGIAVNENNRTFSESWLNEFRTAFETHGGTLAAARFFDSATSDLLEVVAGLLAGRPDGLLFIANAADSARLAQQAHKLSPRTPLIAAEWAGTEQLIELGGKAVDGLMIVQNFNQDDRTPRFQSFREAYIKRFGRNPVYGSVLSHDATSVALAALAKRPDGMTTKAALLRFGPYQGLQQAIAFDANGDTERAAHFMVIRDNRFVHAP